MLTWSVLIAWVVQGGVNNGLDRCLFIGIIIGYVLDKYGVLDRFKKGE